MLYHIIIMRGDVLEKFIAIKIKCVVKIFSFQRNFYVSVIVNKIFIVMGYIHKKSLYIYIIFCKNLNMI